MGKRKEYDKQEDTKNRLRVEFLLKYRLKKINFALVVVLSHKPEQIFEWHKTV